MSILYFTRVGADRIVRQKQELMDKLVQTQRQKGEAAQVGGNVWHDNFSFEQLMRDEEMINSQIAKINEKIAKMVVVETFSFDTSRLRVGHEAVLSVDDEIKVCLIGGFEDFDPDANPPVISYLAPLVAPFVGEKVGHTAAINLDGKIRTVILEEIHLPSQNGGAA